MIEVDGKLIREPTAENLSGSCHLLLGLFPLKLNGNFFTRYDVDSEVDLAKAVAAEPLDNAVLVTGMMKE